MNCSVNRCTKKVKTNGKCAKHYLREWRAQNKMKYAYQTSKDNAKRRGKEFELTLEQFEYFAVTSKYIIGKGRTRESLHMDRIRENEGYTVDNIQALKNHLNVKKYLRYSFDERGKPYHFVNETIIEKKPNTPF